MTNTQASAHFPSNVIHQAGGLSQPRVDGGQNAREAGHELSAINDGCLPDRIITKAKQQQQNMFQSRSRTHRQRCVSFKKKTQ